MPKTIRQQIQDRVAALGLTAYSLAHSIKNDNGGEWVVSVRHLHAYLTGEKDMTGDKIDFLLSHLNLEIRLAE